MDYAQARNQIKSGDLIAMTHNQWNSFYDLQVQAVRTGTQSEYCHMCVAWVIAGRVFVIEAVNPLVRIFPLSNLKDAGFYWLATPDTPMSDKELEFGLSWVGRGEYSKWQAIEAQLNTLDVGADDKWECAELTICMRRLSGLDLGSKATPAAVVQEALKKGYTLAFVSKG